MHRMSSYTLLRRSWFLELASPAVTADEAFGVLEHPFPGPGMPYAWASRWRVPRAQMGHIAAVHANLRAFHVRIRTAK